MAQTDLERLVFQMSADMRKMQSDLNKANGVVDSSTRRMQRGFNRVQSSATNLERTVSISQAGIRRTLLQTSGVLASAFSVTAIKNFADGYTRFTNQLKVAGLEGGRLTDTQEALFQIGQRYGTQLESLGTLYSRLSGASKDLGASDAELLRFTEGVSAALKVQGGDAASASGALLQLSQAIGGGIVRAEEFNSVMEGARPIAQAVADNLDGMGGSVSKLRTAIADGKVTSQEFFQAFLKGSEALKTQAEAANLTIASSFTILNNALGKYIGEADESLSATQKMSQAIQLLANNLDMVVGALVVLSTVLLMRAAPGLLAVAGGFATATVSAGRFVLASASATAAVTGQSAAMIIASASARTLGAAMLTAFGGPLGLAIAAIAGAVFLYNTRLSDAAVKANAVKAAHERLDPILAAVKKSLDAAAGASGKVRDAHLAAADAAFALGEAELVSARKALAAAKARVTAARQVITITGDSTAAAMAGAAADFEERSAQARIAAAEDVLIGAGLGRRQGSRGQGTRFVPIRPSESDYDKPKKPVAPPDDKKGKKAKPRWNGPLPDYIKTAIAQGRFTEASIREEYPDGNFPMQGGVVFTEPITADGVAPVEGGYDQSEFFRGLFENGTREGPRTDLATGPGGVVIPKERYDEIQQGVYGAIRGGLQAGFDEGIPGVMRYLAESIQRTLLDSIAKSLTEAFMSQVSGAGIGSAIAGFLGFRAAGGPVSAGRPYIVGEKGPEMMVPKTGGMVIPNNALKSVQGMSPVGRGGGVTIIQPFHLHAEGAVMTDQLMASFDRRSRAHAARGAAAAVQASRRGFASTMAQQQLLGRT